MIQFILYIKDQFSEERRGEENEKADLYFTGSVLDIVWKR